MEFFRDMVCTSHLRKIIDIFCLAENDQRKLTLASLPGLQLTACYEKQNYISVQKQDAQDYGKLNSTVEHLLETRFLTSKFTPSPPQNISYNKIQLLQCRNVFNKKSSGENGNNTKENLDKYLPFINTQESPELTKAQVSSITPRLNHGWF